MQIRKLWEKQSERWGPQIDRRWCGVRKGAGDIRFSCKRIHTLLGSILAERMLCPFVGFFRSGTPAALNSRIANKEGDRHPWQQEIAINRQAQAEKKSSVHGDSNWLANNSLASLNLRLFPFRLFIRWKNSLQFQWMSLTWIRPLKGVSLGVELFSRGCSLPNRVYGF